MTPASRIPVHRPTRRAFALGGAVALALTTAGCFDNEPEQRKAFIEFLQTRIIDRPGLRIPILSDKNIADLGPYADHYRVMNGFHHRLDESVSKNLRRAMQIGKPRSLEELRNQRAIIPVMMNGMGKLRAELDKALADADTARAALKQPPDLKAVYDKAYDRMVTRPAKVFLELVPMVVTMLPAIETLAAFLDENRDAIEFQGSTTIVKDAKLRARLQVLMNAAVEAAKASDEGKRKLRVLAEGR